MSSSPIGFFDSGIGGISLWKAIKKILPNENSIYLSDSKNCPYGLKSKDKLDEMLVREDRQLLVEACLSFLPIRVDLDLRGWENDIFSHSS